MSKDSGIRTRNRLIKSQMLYQLSYVPVNVTDKNSIIYYFKLQSVSSYHLKYMLTYSL